MPIVLAVRELIEIDLTPDFVKASASRNKRIGEGPRVSATLLLANHLIDPWLFQIVVSPLSQS